MSDISDALSKLSVQGLIDSSRKTGLVYDDRMIEHSCLWDPAHIERPERYMLSLQRCKEYNLIENCHILPSRCATEDELCLNHSKNYIDEIKNSKTLNSVSELEKLSSKYDSVYFHPKTYDAALLAAGSAIELVSNVLKGTVRNGLAVVRPPGHHAMEQQACGFCFFNNVAIAAKYALKEFDIKKILIIDWDVHHGQATQQSFYDDPRVLYFSIHRYEHGEFWPHLRESNFDFTGSNIAPGFNINVPLNATKQGSAEYLSIFNNVLLPIAYEFCPELVIISAGFDAAIGCPEGEMTVTPQTYPHFLNSVSSLANGRICVILEGGYCLPSLSESVALTLRGLLGYPCPPIPKCSDISESCVETILNVISVHRPFWESIRIQNVYDSSYDDDDSVKHVVCPKYAGNPLAGLVTFPTQGYYPVQDPNVVNMFTSEIQNLIMKTDLSVPSHRTCLIFDPKINQHVNKREKNHPEKADRVIKIYEKLHASGLLSKCLLLESRVASEAELALVHDINYINYIKSTSTMSYRDIAKVETELDSVYICHETYESATSACGSLLQAVDAVAQRACVNGFALIRPPGHHADAKTACGFCIFNNVAVAARYLQTHHNMQKILILDWDIHHGNGTQRIFYEDGNVLYVSLHLYDGDFFPGSPEADHTAVGHGQGEGYNINIPFSYVAGDGDYLAAFFHIVLPVAYEFSPDFVLVSAGFDAIHDDPLGGCFVTPPCFGIMTKLLSGLCNGKIVLALEGGYNIPNTSDAAIYCIGSLLNEFPMPHKPMKPTLNAMKTIQSVVKTHKKYWKSLKFDVEVPDVTSMSMSEDINFNDFNRNKPLRTSDPVAIPRREESGSFCMNDCDGAVGISGGETFYCVTPLEYCPHLELLQQIPAEGLNPYSPCQACNDPTENWVCLHCYQVYCGRFINQHMLQHGMDMQHYLTLSYSDLSVWCYACDAYIHNNVLVPIKEHACHKKFA
ncbi:histone deacetylase 6-like [Uloborus diversus]|uniref:histone deacetylase 6-like n=1 Tax=Uloborus diversus TaxID=327109 RepID=UPI0024097D9C|nr:histone deacetylase 6-like [Uloborus diversus]